MKPHLMILSKRVCEVTPSLYHIDFVSLFKYTFNLFPVLVQLIPQISSLSWFTTIVPLALVLSITAVKDATDDYVSI